MYDVYWTVYKTSNRKQPAYGRDSHRSETFQTEAEAVAYAHNLENSCRPYNADITVIRRGEDSGAGGAVVCKLNYTEGEE